MQHFDDYQLFTDTTAIYPQDIGISYASLGLVGEVGEFAEKLHDIAAEKKTIAINYDQLKTFNEFKDILEQATKLGVRAEKPKKELRDGKRTMPPVIVKDNEQREGLVLELGDLQHYVAREARHLLVDLSTVAYENVTKIGSRKARGVIEGNGDYR